MFHRAELKANAKGALKGKYWWAFLACLIIEITAILFSSISSFYSVTGNMGMYWVTYVLYILLVLFIVYPLTVGLVNYFIGLYQREQNISDMFAVFMPGRYLNTVLTMFLNYLYIFLWSLLFIIPGIIKTYSYSMVPYILAENPTMKPSEVITLSRKMTNGYKFNIFVLQLSFLGWFLLGMLALGIGVFFVVPYYNATMTGLYFKLKQNAFENGIIISAEQPM